MGGEGGGGEERGGGRRRERGEDKVGKEKKVEVIPHIQLAAMYNGTQYIFML